MRDTITTTEAAAILAQRGIIHDTGKAITAADVQRWCWQDKIPGAEKVGSAWRGEWRIPREVIETWAPPKRGWRLGRPRKKDTNDSQNDSQE